MSDVHRVHDAGGHIHDCTGPDLLCACGYRFLVPPVSVAFDVYVRGRRVVDDHFNCESLESAASAFEAAARRIREWSE